MPALLLDIARVLAGGFRTTPVESVDCAPAPASNHFAQLLQTLLLRLRERESLPLSEEIAVVLHEMFAKPHEILRSREGLLADTPLPLLLHAILVEERTCALDLQVRQLEKRIVFEEGAPIDCASNLLHETLGKFLVERGKLSEKDYQTTLNESIQSGTTITELLIRKGLIPPSELYKQLQANLAHKILDCFRWSDARYRILGDVTMPDTGVRMNSVQLILKGCSTLLPFEIVASQLTFVDEQKFALVPNARYAISELKLGPKETKLLQTLRAKPPLSGIVTKTGLDTEEAMRRLFGFCVLGLVDFADSIAQPEESNPTPEAAPPRAPEVLPATPVPVSAPPTVEDHALREAVTKASLEFRNKDPFDLLEVDESAAPLLVRKAFLALADRFAPNRFIQSDLREKAEALLIAYARAFGALADPETLALHRKRRAAAVEAKRRTPRPSTAEQFRISTSLLDASSQFAEGRKRLEANNVKAALEYLQYACDIDPKPRYRAYLAWTRYLINPRAYARLALQELAEAGRIDENCEEAHFYAGEIHRAEKNFSAAEISYRLAQKANPKKAAYGDLALESMRLKGRS